MDAETYQTRLVDNGCTYSTGCDRPAVDDTALCKRHLKRSRKSHAASMQRLRDARAARGECRSCGTKRRPGERCTTCTAKRPERIRVEAVTAPVTAGDPFRRDNDGWKRYRGKGRRGPPRAGVNDEQDLRDAGKALEAGRRVLAYARSPEVQALPRIQRAGVKSEAAAQLALAAGLVAQVVERNDPERAKSLAMLRTEIAGDGELGREVAL